MTERIVRTPAGFVEVNIILDPSIPTEISGFIRTGVSIKPAGAKLVSFIIIAVGEGQLIPLEPGLYTIKASMGSISSEETNVEVKAGQTVKLVFSFGKKTD